MKREAAGQAYWGRDGNMNCGNEGEKQDHYNCGSSGRLSPGGGLCMFRGCERDIHNDSPVLLGPHVHRKVRQKESFIWKARRNQSHSLLDNRSVVWNSMHPTNLYLNIHPPDLHSNKFSKSRTPLSFQSEIQDFVLKWYQVSYCLVSDGSVLQLTYYK